VELVIQAHLRLLLEQPLDTAAVVELVFGVQLLPKLAVLVEQVFQVAVAVAQIQVALQQTQQVAQVVKV
jgi:hypothetical protein